MEFSLLISIYFRENSLFFSQAIDSILNQTCIPNEIVLVKDGPLNQALDSVIDNYASDHPGLFKIITLEKNQGLGNALKIGLLACRYEIVARMDTDDISRKDRFEKQLLYLKSNPKIAVVGSNIEEFNEVPGDLGKLRKIPFNSEDIHKFSKLRNPMNHPSVMLRRSAVLDSGGYQSDIIFFEDYSLFVRMLAKGYKMSNLAEPLLFFRIGNGLSIISRRSGLSYCRQEVNFAKMAYKIGHFSKYEVVKFLLLRIPSRILPASLTLMIYQQFLRERL